jgi:hypothetical protein
MPEVRPVSFAQVANSICRNSVAWAYIACLLFPSAPVAIAQEKPPSKPAPRGTLLVICDLPCQWNLDGEKDGHIEAGKSAKLNVMPGEHVVTAMTEDGLDGVRQVAEVKEGKQKLVQIQLLLVRYARLRVEQEATQERARAEQERQKQEQQAQHQEREAAEGYWTDPDTGLVWTRAGYGEGTYLTKQQAAEYCSKARVAGHTDWRLPTIEELRGIYLSSPKNGWHAKGNLRISDWQWSSTIEDSSVDPWQLNFDDGRAMAPNPYSHWARVLCVRNSAP